MTIPDGYHLLEPGKLAAVVTYLEMRAEPEPRPEPAAVRYAIRRLADASPATYLDLYRRVGGDRLWSTRLRSTERELGDALADPRIELHVLADRGRAAGFAELDRRVAGECELVYFGVVPELVGTGAARQLMNRAIAAAWSRPVTRFWLRTCTLDHPRALAFYERSGFRAYARGVEIFDDPRVRGDLPVDSASDVPLL